MGTILFYSYQNNCILYNINTTKIIAFLGLQMDPKTTQSTLDWN